MLWKILFSLMLHTSVAEKLRLNPNEVLQKEILDTQTSTEIIKIITQDTNEGQRLRSSSPFVAVLGECAK
jgi:hypothetical protein